jgi:hypothetical protein
MGSSLSTQNATQNIQLNTSSYAQQVNDYAKKYTQTMPESTDGKGTGRNGAFKDEKSVIDALNAFNLQYATYIKCNNPSTKAGCSSSDIAWDTVRQKGTALTTAISLLGPDINNMNNKITPSQYDSSFNAILNQHNNIQTTRSELDSKLKELYEIPGSFVVDSKYQYDSTMYTGIIFTILATSMLYYTFTKL